MDYSAETLVRLARRDGNTVRPYLYVNPVQAKHIPADPADTLDMCRALAERVRECHPDDVFHVIGLAETATAVAAGVASFLDGVLSFQTTTREYDEHAEILFFTESHSHATDQTLRTAGLSDCLRRITRVLIVDDEVTTGSTILKLIAAVRGTGGAPHVRFTVVSVLNSMTDGRIGELDALGVDCVFLARLPYEYRAGTILDIGRDPDREMAASGAGNPPPEELMFLCPFNQREAVSFSAYADGAEAFAAAVREAFFENRPRCGRLLVLGTEEFMYPAVVTGNLLRMEGLVQSVRVHATTRSPILPSGREGYPLFRRYRLRSMYDDGRRTFVYNLAAYDRVVIVTDAPAGQAGLGDLVQALGREGCRDVKLARWITRKGTNMR